MRGSHRPLAGVWKKSIRVRLAVCCMLALGFFAIAVAVATGQIGSDNHPSGPIGAHDSFSSNWVSLRERVLNHEALPCTGVEAPINFEIFSAGPSIAGVPFTGVQRRCGGSAPADEPSPDFINYIYGHCEIPAGATGCEPPLEIQTWPACQRSLGDYSFEGHPVPFRRLQDVGGAEVVEINFMVDNRIEVYTKSSTIVIFANTPDLAKKALGSLRSQQIGKPPATEPQELNGEPGQGLGPPIPGAMKGDLPCQV